MHECKILKASASPLQHPIKQLTPGNSLMDFPLLEKEINNYLEYGFKVKNITYAHGEILVYLER